MTPVSSTPVLGDYRLHPSLLGSELPPTLSLETTNHCNLRCTHCGHTQYKPFQKGYLDQALFDKVSPHLGRGGIRSVNLSDFGEPFMSKGFWKLFAQARDIPDLRISFITNAVLLDRHLDRLDHPGLDIAVSMDGASEETFGAFRGAGHFDKVVNNLRLLRDRERAGTLPRSGRTFIVVLSRQNVDEMAALVELAAELGVQAVLFTFQVFFDPERFRAESLYFARERYDLNLAKAVQRARDLGVHLLHPDAFDGSVRVPPEIAPKSWLWRDLQGRVQCGMIYNDCYVKFHGQVEACCVPDRYPLGNLHEDDFIDVWHGPYYRRLRQSFRTGTWTATCQNCNIYQSVDVSARQSHFLLPMRDDGSLIPMPQPYRVTELDNRYRTAIDTLVEQPASPATAMREFLNLSTVDDRLHEVLNAIGAVWLSLDQPERGIPMLRQAAALAPEDDPVILHNLARLDLPAHLPPSRSASTLMPEGLNAEAAGTRPTSPASWLQRLFRTG